MAINAMTAAETTPTPIVHFNHAGAPVRTRETRASVDAPQYAQNFTLDGIAFPHLAHFINSLSAKHPLVPAQYLRLYSSPTIYTVPNTARNNISAARACLRK